MINLIGMDVDEAITLCTNNGFVVFLSLTDFKTLTSKAIILNHKNWKVVGYTTVEKF